jgi:4-amino-4-deoxy-L-arabinose transferase-like glycosyltransferase
LYKIEKYFFHIIIAIFVAKFLLAYLIPVTADEAYFWIWGQHLDINYYDHPPLTGWIVWLFSLLGDHIFFSRLFAILSGLAVAVGIHHLVRDELAAPEKAKLICLAFAVCPLHLLFVLITTDTPVFLFVFLSGLAFFYSLKRQSHMVMILAGSFCGLAILSKYFGGLLAIAFLVTLIYRRDRNIITHLLCLLAGVLPFVAFHLYGNYQTCWTNVMFNVYNRNQTMAWKFSGLMLFLGFQAYLATPWAIYYLVKNARRIASGIQQRDNVFTLLFMVPMVLFAIVSFHDTGLHWTLGFYPFMFLLLVHLERAQIKRIVTLSLIFSIFHAVVIFGALTWKPIKLFKNHQYYNDLVMAYYGPELYQKVKKRYGNGYILATNGYYTSAAMSYHSKEYFIVFLDESKHGRYDDKLTDFRQLDGKNILSLRTLPTDHHYDPYFEKVTYEKMAFKEGTFYIVRGEKFRYAEYHKRFLEKIRKRWYNIPDFLPMGDCYFDDMYFNNE